MDHQTRCLAGTNHCNVLQCSCGMLHVTLGPIIMWVDFWVVGIFHAVLGEALARIGLHATDRVHDLAANDVPDPEVMLEVQVLEVSADRVSNLGIKWPDAFGISTPSSANTVGELRALTRNDLVTTPLSVALNLMLQDTETNILASPRIRTRNKEKARILVGDKVPVITNLLTPQQAGATSVITGSIQYVDVGIKLEVEPQVYVDNDVGIKINLEVSNIAKTVETASGIAYQIGTRSAQTSLRLRDGAPVFATDLEGDGTVELPPVAAVPPRVTMTVVSTSLSSSSVTSYQVLPARSGNRSRVTS